MASLTAQVTAPSGVRVLTIGVGPTFAMRWLIPRLADFRKHEPDIDVRITTGGAAAPFGDDWSCGIKLGDGEWPGLVAEPLFAADLLPVCAPRLAAQLKRASDLRGPSLLRVAHASEDWPLWLKAAGVARVTARGPEFQYYGQALQAAADGLGVAMGIRPYIDDDLAAGRQIVDRKSTRLNSSHLVISYAVFCLKIKTTLASVDSYEARVSHEIRIYQCYLCA